MATAMNMPATAATTKERLLRVAPTSLAISLKPIFRAGGWRR